MIVMNNAATKHVNFSLEFRDKWRKKRRAKEISVEEIAQIIGCSHAHISQWEKKENHSVQYDKVQIYMDYIENYQA
jgi:DNA-binding transcriptional regulator YiaG